MSQDELIVFQQDVAAAHRARDRRFPGARRKTRIVV